MYLEGKEFVLETNHAPLQWLHSMKNSNQRLLRWSLTLQEFRFQISYISDMVNVVADMLSRGANPEDLGMQSRWQSGPDFLKQPVEQWPVRQSFSGAEIPELAKVVNVNAAKADNLVDVSTIILIAKDFLLMTS